MCGGWGWGWGNNAQSRTSQQHTHAQSHTDACTRKGKKMVYYINDKNQVIIVLHARMLHTKVTVIIRRIACRKYQPFIHAHTHAPPYTHTRAPTTLHTTAASLATVFHCQRTELATASGVSQWDLLALASKPARAAISCPVVSLPVFNP